MVFAGAGLRWAVRHGVTDFASAEPEAARERVRRRGQTVQLKRYTTEQFVARAEQSF